MNHLHASKPKASPGLFLCIPGELLLGEGGGTVFLCAPLPPPMPGGIAVIKTNFLNESLTVGNSKNEGSGNKGKALQQLGGRSENTGGLNDVDVANLLDHLQKVKVELAAMLKEKKAVEAR